MIQFQFNQLLAWKQRRRRTATIKTAIFQEQDSRGGGGPGGEGKALYDLTSPPAAVNQGGRRSPHTAATPEEWQREVIFPICKWDQLHGCRLRVTRNKDTRDESSTYVEPEITGTTGRGRWSPTSKHQTPRDNAMRLSTPSLQGALYLETLVLGGRHPWKPPFNRAIFTWKHLFVETICVKPLFLGTMYLEAPRFGENRHPFLDTI